MTSRISMHPAKSRHLLIPQLSLNEYRVLPINCEGRNKGLDNSIGSKVQVDSDATADRTKDENLGTNDLYSLVKPQAERWLSPVHFTHGEA